MNRLSEEVLVLDGGGFRSDLTAATHAGHRLAAAGGLPADLSRGAR